MIATYNHHIKRVVMLSIKISLFMKAWSHDGYVGTINAPYYAREAKLFHKPKNKITFYYVSHCTNLLNIVTYLS